ncbi:hypothetical protein ACFFWD_06555 [Bradyrhizobium erythrophlei]|uniref:hypothetical protein n=1 Tax=Bradyrhizobium erythrophlei TaxID=1437360 RepID=UPI0035E7317E
MTAQIFSSHDFLWKLVERNIAAFLDGRERDMELANIGRAIGFGLLDQIEPIKDCWAEARKMKEAKQRPAADRGA